MPDLELLPGALQPHALYPDAIIVHSVHGLAAVQYHLQRRDWAAHLGHGPRLGVHHSRVRLKLRPQRLRRGATSLEQSAWLGYL